MTEVEPVRFKFRFLMGSMEYAKHCVDEKRFYSGIFERGFASSLPRQAIPQRFGDRKSESSAGA